MPRTQGTAASAETDMKHFTDPNLSVVAAKYCFLDFEVRDRTFIRNADLHDRMYDCLPTSMAAVLSVELCAYFLFVSDVSGRHHE